MTRQRKKILLFCRIKIEKPSVGFQSDLLLPDSWNTSIYNLSNINNTGASFSSNTITAEQWSILEQHGVVFLPAAGYRMGTSLTSVGSGCKYWSASCSSIEGASGIFPPQSGSWRYCGFCVRLVTVSEN